MNNLYGVIFFVSSAVLMFEVSLIRLFSIYLWYHFAFLVISLAMLGIGSAGTYIAFAASAQSCVKDRTTSLSRPSGGMLSFLCSSTGLAVCALLSGLFILISFFTVNMMSFDPVKLQWDKVQFLYLGLACFVLSIPFFFAGMIIALAFTSHSERSGVIYSADLIGAGCGSLLVLLLLDRTAPEHAVILSSVFCMAGAAIISRMFLRLLSGLLAAGLLLVLLVYPDAVRFTMSPYKNLSLFLKYPGARHLNTYHSSYSRLDTFESPAVRFAPGLSFSYMETLPSQFGIAFDGEGIDAISDGRSPDHLRFLEFLPAALPYQTGRKERVLVIDPGGGLHVLLAKHYGASVTRTVISNPLLKQVVVDEYHDFSGGLYIDNSRTGYGRNVIEEQMKMYGQEDPPPGILFDLIDIPMTEAAPSRSFGISENYQFTVEAFETYLRALSTEGMLSVSLYLVPPPRTEFRALASIITAMERTGMNDPASRIAAIRSWDSMTIIAGKSPLTENDIRTIKDFAAARRFDLVYYPGIQQNEINRYIKLPHDDYYEGFSRIIIPDTRHQFLASYLFDVGPVQDERPFFHYHLKLSNIKAIYNIMGQKPLYLIEEGYLLPVIFVLILFFASLIVLLPSVLTKGRVNGNDSPAPAKLSVFSYFAMLGLGFMFVEVPLIQKSILFLENPSYAFSAVIAGILVSSGMGSYASARAAPLRTPAVLLVLAIVVALINFVYPVLLSSLMGHGMKARMIGQYLSLFPLGFFMGIPFPLGIRILGEQENNLIPWAWAINASLSVLAPVAAMMIATVAGFSLVLWLGVLCYVSAYFFLRRMVSA